jgi:hypothetical protein
VPDSAFNVEPQRLAARYYFQLPLRYSLALAAQNYSNFPIIAHVPYTEQTKQMLLIQQ